jgi:hypothetical protein
MRGREWLMIAGKPGRLLREKFWNWKFDGWESLVGILKSWKNKKGFDEVKSEKLTMFTMKFKINFIVFFMMLKQNSPLILNSPFFANTHHKAWNSPLLIHRFHRSTFRFIQILRRSSKLTTAISFPSTSPPIPATSAIFLSQFSHHASSHHTSSGKMFFEGFQQREMERKTNKWQSS